MNKMGTSKKKNLKIAAATGMTLFSLVAVFTATIAWFVALKRVTATGIHVIASQESGRLNKVEIYEYVETLQKPVYDDDGNLVVVNGETVTAPNYSFKDEPSATIFGDVLTSKDLVMKDYNMLSTDHPLLILFTLESGFVSHVAGDMYVKGTTSADGFLGAIDSNGKPIYKLGDLGPDDDPEVVKTLKNGTKSVTVNGTTKTVDTYPLSSAVNFKCAQFSSSAYTTLISRSTNERIDLPIDSISLRQSFVNFASSGAGITFKKDPTIFSSLGDGKSIYCVAMVVNYDGNAISAIYSTYLGNTTLEDTYGGELYFTCDWSLEVF